MMDGGLITGVISSAGHVEVGVGQLRREIVAAAAFASL